MRVPPCFFLPCRIFRGESEDNVSEVIFMSKKNKTKNENTQSQYDPGHGPVQLSGDSAQSSTSNKQKK